MAGFALAACDGASPTSPSVTVGPVGPVAPASVNPGGVSNTDSVAAEPFSFEVAAQGPMRLRLEGINGTISVVGSSGARSVSITGERRVGSESMEDAQAALQLLQVKVEELASEVFVETIQPQDNQGRNYVVDYTVTLPRNFAVSIMNINGDVTVREMLSSTYVDLVNGQIDGKVDLPQDGTVDLSTANGPIALDIPHNTSSQFSANVTNGRIELSNLTLQSEERTPTSLQGRLADGRGMITLRTVNGDIGVRGY
jgi:DUF4097 and DUF4098 domain-containing protein YvlB